MIALGYGVGLAAGVAALLSYWSSLFGSRPAKVTAAATLFALPFIWTATMVWGGNGQLAPRHYPDGWFAVNDARNAQTGSASTLFLPWHVYLHTDFAGRTIANPAPDFFDKPVIASDDPGLPGIAADSPTNTTRRITALIADRSPGSGSKFAAELSQLGIGYIILAKENNYREYLPLVSQPGIRLVTQTPTINLYQIQQRREI
jgi:hypothetical protein